MDDLNQAQNDNIHSMLNTLNRAQIRYEEMSDELAREKSKWIDLNKTLQEEIGKFQRNGSLGFYIFMSTTMACIVYLLSK